MNEFPRLSDEQLLTFMLTMCQPVILELQRRNGRPAHEQAGAIRDMMETLGLGVGFGPKFDVSGNIAAGPSAGVIVKKDKVVKMAGGGAAKTRKKPAGAPKPDSEEFEDTPPRDPFAFDNSVEGSGVRIEIQDLPVEVDVLFNDATHSAPIDIKPERKKK